MNVFLTGATGFIGRALTLRLIGDGHRVTAWTRAAGRARARLGADVDILEITEDDAALRQALEQADAVINLAGEPIVGGRWTEARKYAIIDSRVGATRRLVEAMAACDARPRVLLSASAVGYYGDRGDDMLIETDVGGDGFIAEVCKHWEQAALRAADLGARVALMRIGVVLGRGGGMLDRILPFFRLGLGGRIGSGRQFMPWVHLDDVIEVFTRALVDERMAGPINVSAPRPVDNREFTSTLATALGRPALLAVPAWAVRLSLGQAASLFLGSFRAVPARLMALEHEFTFPALESALLDVLAADCEFEPAVDIPDSPYLRARRPRYVLHQELDIDAPIEQVFEFFSQAENLGAITPPSLSFDIETPPPVRMQEGTIIDYRMRVGPAPMRWRTEIERWRPGESFVDLQVKGPYRTWWHEHRFIGQGERTRMEDRVYYSPPFGVLGRVVDTLAVRPMLRRIFGYRAQAIRHRFAGEGANPPPARKTRRNHTRAAG